MENLEYIFFHIGINFQVFIFYSFEVINDFADFGLRIFHVFLAVSSRNVIFEGLLLQIGLPKALSKYNIK